MPETNLLKTGRMGGSASENIDLRPPGGNSTIFTEADLDIASIDERQSHLQLIGVLCLRLRRPTTRDLSSSRSDD
jgi:hypothetical protein